MKTREKEQDRYDYNWRKLLEHGNLGKVTMAELDKYFDLSPHPHALSNNQNIGAFKKRSERIV